MGTFLILLLQEMHTEKDRPKIRDVPVLSALLAVNGVNCPPVH